MKQLIVLRSGSVPGAVALNEKFLSRHKPQQQVVLSNLWSQFTVSSDMIHKELLSLVWTECP